MIILLVLVIAGAVAAPSLWKAYSKGGFLEGTDWEAKERIAAQGQRKASEDRGYAGSDEVLVGNLILPEEIVR